jgi:hypothetical protein
LELAEKAGFSQCGMKAAMKENGSKVEVEEVGICSEKINPGCEGIDLNCRRRPGAY